tara:strand:+ start:1 stop:2892 length:2892 start_codon:yes stop_codon:yes gene_type:complete
MKGLGRGISYGTAPLGLAFGVPNIKEGIEEGDVSKTFVGTGETLGGLYSLREIIRRLPAKSRSTAILKAINKGLDYIPGGKLTRTLSKKRLPGEQTFRDNPSLAVPSLVGLYGGEQAIDQMADVSRGKPPDAMVQEIANIFNVSPEALQPQRVVTQEPSEEEKAENLRLARLDSYEQADDRTGLKVNVPELETETVDEQAALTDDSPDSDDKDIPIIADNTVDTTETEEKEDITTNQEVEKTVEQDQDPRQKIVSDTVAELDNMDLTISTGDGTDINNPKIVVGEDLPEEESKIEPFSQKNMQATFDRLKKVDDPVQLILESNMNVEDYEDAAVKYKQNALISMKLLKDFEAENPRNKMTWDQYRNKFKIDARDETKDFILLKFGLGLMSARTDLPGFSGFMDILGRVGAQSVDELQQVYQAERARQQRLRENFAQYEMQLENNVRADKVNMLNSQLRIFNDLNNSLMNLNIKKIDNDFQLNLEQMRLEADLKQKLMDMKAEMAKTNIEITKDLMEAADLNPETADKYTILFSQNNFLRGTHMLTGMSKDGKIQFVDSKLYEDKDKNVFIGDGSARNFIPTYIHNNRVDRAVEVYEDELKELNKQINQENAKLITVTVDGKEQVLTDELFQKFKDTEQFKDIDEDRLNNNITTVEKIKELKRDKFTVAGNIVQLEDIRFKKDNTSNPRKEEIPSWMRGALTSANLALGQTGEILALMDYAQAKNDTSLTGFRGRIAELFLNLKDVVNATDQEAVSIDDINSEITNKAMSNLISENVKIVDAKGNETIITVEEIMKRAEKAGVKDSLFGTNSNLYKNIEKKAESFIQDGSKLSDATKRAIQTRLRVLETVLTFQLANALKEQDRLTEKNIEEARKLLNLFGFTGPGGVRNRVLATQKTIKERFISNVRNAHSSGMKESEINNLAEQIYYEVKQEHLNKRVANYLKVPEKNIISIQEELQKSIGE